MKSLFLFAALLVQCYGFAQEPCEFDVDVSDSLGTLKETKEYLVYERNFAGTSSYVYFSLALVNKVPMLKVQMISRSKDFIPSNCLDKNARLYLQLDNGKIVTLRHVDELTCGTSVRNNQGFNNNIITGTFMFVNSNVEELMNSPVTLMRIKYTTETADYIFPSQLKSELHQQTYDPQHYFLATLRCLANQ